jgi:DNA-binding transcriptional regulator PaaX
MLGWDKSRFDRLKKAGWFEIFRRKVGHRKQLYKLSDKTINVVRLIYKKLSGEEIPVSQSQNKMFAKNVSYSDKVYRNMIKEMNAFIKQQRHHAPE